MVDRDYFNHVILGTSYQIYHWYDSNGLSWSSGGENIGYNNGFSDADSPVKINEGFMNSSGHRANILEPAWSHGGVGAYGKDGAMWGGKVRNIRMYTELFIQLKSAAPPPPPPSAYPAAGSAAAAAATPAARRDAEAGRGRPRSPRRARCPLDDREPTPVPTPDPTPAADSRSKGRRPRDHARDAARQRIGIRLPVPSRSLSHSMRVESASAPDRGIFETVIGSLLSFFLG